MKRHTVRVVDHHPGWAELAAEACRRVRKAGGNLIADVQHVGSTAVPDLPAKPILDLAASVHSLDAIPELVERLTALGYIYRGCSGNSGGHLFVWEPEPDIRTIHLHIVASDDVQWTNYLRFRELLRQDPVVRARYATLKEQLRRRFADDRKSYTMSKHDFIRSVLKTEAQPEVGPVSPEAAPSAPSDEPST
ncbi:MAG: GrpB family protein [Kiritimatiellae bacterium]|nr:GrpB family protein [Kiritimatiellia bacterium]